MQGFKCNVTSASTTAKPLAKAQVPVYCENEPEKCVRGAKQMLAWNQATGNNIETAPGLTPNYNQKCGWAEGAQKDIFEVEAGTPVPVLSTPALAVVPSPMRTTSVITSSTSVEVVWTTSLPIASVAVSVESKPSCTAKQARYAPQNGRH
jgi:hypothetical protein